MIENFDIKIQDFASTLLACAKKQVLKKAIFSKSKDKTIIKTVLTLKNIGGTLCLQAESFHTDNKAKHQNIALDDGTFAKICAMIDSYMQINLISTLGECEYKSSKWRV